MASEKRNLPNLPADQIARYKKAGLWPPPAGIILLPEAKPSEKEVNNLLEALVRSLPPSKRDLINKVHRTSDEEKKAS